MANGVCTQITSFPDWHILLYRHKEDNNQYVYTMRIMPGVDCQTVILKIKKKKLYISII